MTLFVIACLVVFVLDVFAKVWRLHTQNMAYQGGAVVFDLMVCIAMTAWGCVVLFGR